MKNLLLIFAKNPDLGKVKTRLAESIGEQKALEIYQLCPDTPNEEATAFGTIFWSG